MVASYKKSHPRLVVFMRIRERCKLLNRINELVLDDIEQMLDQPCEYCGDEATTIDRRDSNVGYTKQNCAPCCLVCNILKKDVPYPAWLTICVGVREARYRGLLHEWATKKHRTIGCRQTAKSTL